MESSTFQDSLIDEKEGEKPEWESPTVTLLDLSLVTADSLISLEAGSAGMVS